MIHASIQPTHVTRYGAGYPLTYAFDVPDQPGLVGQVSVDGATWATIPAAPAERFDGIDAARITDTRAYLSVAFPPNMTRMRIRVVDAGGADVGAYTGVCEHYDDRAAAVMFTYDDSTSTSIRASEVHRANKLWMSPGINSGRLSEYTITPAQLAQIVQAGYVEPINHGYDHLRAGVDVGLTESRADIIGGRDGILAATTMPPQSRGHVHAYIYPGGTVSEAAYQCCVEAGHLAARITQSQAGGAAYGHASEVIQPWGIVTLDQPEAAGALADIDAAAQAVLAQKFIDSVNLARARRARALLYSYTYHWDVGLLDGNPWQQMIATIGAMTDIWSVGYGHYYLYRATSAALTVTDFPSYRSLEWEPSGYGTLATTTTSKPGQAGDLLVAVRADADMTKPQTITGTGWTQQTASTGGLAVWTKIAGTAAPVPVEMAGTNSGRYVSTAVLRYANVDPDQPVTAAARQANAASLTATAPAVTSGPGTVLRIWRASKGSYQDVSVPAGMSARAQWSTAVTELAMAIADHATAGNPAASDAGMVASATSVGVTLVLAWAPTERSGRRRGGSLVGLI